MSEEQIPAKSIRLKLQSRRNRVYLVSQKCLENPFFLNGFSQFKVVQKVVMGVLSIYNIHVLVYRL